MANVRIDIGDKVGVHFNNAQITLCHKAIVHSIPQATGDFWVFQDDETGQLYYVSEGCTITLLEKHYNLIRKSEFVRGE